MSIDQFIESLPEIYQPIFGHPKYDSQASRHCEDRLESITQIYSALRKRMGRDLVVLDLGCAQGYFSLSLAASGAEVVAIDYGPENIDLCKSLLKDNAGFKVRFEIGDIINIEALLDESKFDVVIGLSVLHHLTHLHGHESIRQLIASIVERCGIFIYETALKEEPVYWATSLPADPRELFADIPFAHQHSEYATHLSNINRPLFILSDKYWVLGNNAEPFEYFKNQSHALEGNSHGGSRRYYFSDGFVAKVFRLDHPRGEINRKEHAQEIHFAGSSPPGFRAAKCAGYGESRHSVWVILERINGKNLDQMIADDDGYDAEHIIQSVAGQLAVLEKAGLFHSDIRTWNVMLDQNHTAFVIDYGAISRVPMDCVWPGNIYFSFLMFCNEVINKSVGNPSILRSTPFGPTSFKMPYEKWVHHLWSLHYSKWRFDYLHRTLTEYPFERKKYANISAPQISPWNSSLGQALLTVVTSLREGLSDGQDEIVSSIVEKLWQWSDQTDTMSKHIAEIDELHIRVPEAEKRAAQAEAQTIAARRTLRELELKMSASEASLTLLHSKLGSSETRVAQLLQSFSWKITLPLRSIFDSIRNLFSLIGKIITFVLQIPKKVAQSLFRASMLLALKSSMIEKLVMRFLAKRPTLHSHLKAFATTHKVLSDSQSAPYLTNPGLLSESAGLQHAAANVTNQEIGLFSSEITPTLTIDELMTRLKTELTEEKI
ncbi:methyltransferase domain-containing protein [Luminiphilus sp.]|nr:methyltransferase domain-containing protein [Luminiphilus sp.]